MRTLACMFPVPQLCSLVNSPESTSKGPAAGGVALRYIYGGVSLKVVCPWVGKKVALRVSRHAGRLILGPSPAIWHACIFYLLPFAARQGCLGPWVLGGCGFWGPGSGGGCAKRRPALLLARAGLGLRRGCLPVVIKIGGGGARML